MNQRTKDLIKKSINYSIVYGFDKQKKEVKLKMEEDVLDAIMDALAED